MEHTEIIAGYKANQLELLRLISEIQAVQETAQSEVAAAKESLALRVGDLEALRGTSVRIGYGELDDKQVSNPLYPAWQLAKEKITQFEDNLAKVEARWVEVTTETAAPKKAAPKEAKVDSEVKELSQKAKIALLCDDYIARNKKHYGTGLTANQLLGYVINEKAPSADPKMVEYRQLAIDKYKATTKARLVQDLAEYIASKL
jgi:hypothetical protein